MPEDKRTRMDDRSALNAAAQKLGAGDREGAIVVLKELLTEQPRHLVALGMLGGIYADLRMYERAAEQFRAVLALDAANLLARFQLGLVLLTAGDIDAAFREWQPAFSDAEAFLSQFQQGLVQLQSGHRLDGARLLEAAVDSLPRSHPLATPMTNLIGHLQQG